MISDTTHFGLKGFLLKSERLEVFVSKKFGAKITSFYDLVNHQELLFQPTKKNYTTPLLGEDFSNFDTSGIDDCFPTIDACTLHGKDYPDHGSLWSIPWNLEATQDTIKAWVLDPVSKLTFQRNMTLSKNSLHINYTVFNGTQEAKTYMWAFHGLFQIKPKMKLLLPFSQEEVVNVLSSEKYPFSIVDLEEYPLKQSYKFYYPEALKKNNSIGYYYPETNTQLLFHYSVEELPYLGVWITTGGFKGEINCAIEPSTSYYDSLTRSFENGTAKILQPKETFSFSITLEVQEVPNGRITI